MAADGIDLDLVLNELGAFGRYQLRTFALLLIPLMYSGMFNSQYIFTAADVDYRCQVPQCESDPPEYEAAWWEWALPDDARCHRLVPVDSACSEGAFSNQTEGCDAWVYASRDTIVAEFDIACRAWQRTLIGTVRTAGMFLALLLIGPISDTFGRRHALILTAVSHAPTALLRSFSSSYTMFIIVEFLEAFFGSGIYNSGYVLALEMITRDKRVLAGNIISSFFATGQILLALIAWAVPYWRNLIRIIYVPSVLFLFYYYFIEESVRWLITQKRHDEAKAIILKAAAINKVELSTKVMKQLEPDEDFQECNTGLEELIEKNEKSLAFQVVRSRIIMSRWAICAYSWITMTFVYYGLSINSVSLGSNMYVSYILTSMAEWPGYAMSVLSLNRFGRKHSIMTAFFFCGVSLIALPFVPQELSWLWILLNMLGKLWICMAFGSMYVFTAELFPTAARGTLLAYSSMVGRLGQMLAPMTPLLMNKTPSLPYLIFGVMALGGALLMTLTPETLHTRLPNTIAQAEEMARARKTKKQSVSQPGTTQ